MKIEELLNYDGEYVKNYILCADNREQSELLKNRRIKEFFFKVENHYSFVWLLYELKKNQLEVFLDDCLIQLLIADSKFSDKMGAIFSIDNEVINSFLNDERLIKKIIESNGLSIYFGRINGDALDKAIKLCLEDSDLAALSKLDNDRILNLLNDEENYNKFVNSAGLRFELMKFDKKIIELLIKDSKIQALLLDDSAELLSDVASKNITFPNNMYDEIISKFMEVSDINKYRALINEFKKSNVYLYDLIEKSRHRLYDEKVNGITNGLLPECQDISKNNVYQDIHVLEKYTSRQMFEMLCDKYFEEYANNILINIDQMLSFNEELNNKIIPIDRVEIYKMISSFMDLSIDDKIKIYHNLPKNISEIFYTDYRNCENYVIDMINSEIPRVENLKKERKDDYEYHVLDGENFVMPIHCSIYGKWQPSKLKTTLCMSLIGNEHLGTFNVPSESLILGFSALNPKSIMHMYHTDSFTARERSTTRIMEIFSPHTLLRNTKGYNEILVDYGINDYSEKVLKPAFVICYDVVRDIDIRNSKELQLPIIMIKTKSYERNNNHCIEFEGERYINGYNDIGMKKRY